MHRNIFIEIAAKALKEKYYSLLLHYINQQEELPLAEAYELDRELMIANLSIEDDLELTVSDDGVSIPEDLDIEQTDTMGWHLVKVLAEQTLEGKMELNRTEGTQFHFLLKRAKYKPRI